VTVPAFSSTAVANTFSISGTISGSGGNGATVALSGASTATTTANSSGAYTFTGLANGTYAVTPSNSGFSFSPTVQTATVNGANVTVPAFSSTAVANTFSISGTISGSGGNGATVALSGASTATTSANSSGAYTFTGLANGTYTVTPSLTGFTFGPASQPVTVNGANVTALAFSSTIAVAHSATMTWTASASSVTGYNVYRGSVSGGPYSIVNTSLVTTLTYTDSTVQAGQTYFYVTTSVDSAGTESTFSNEVSGTIPTP